MGHRWTNIAGWKQPLDFGQVVPLGLLVLPLLAAAEIFHGKSPPRATFMY